MEVRPDELLISQGQPIKFSITGLISNAYTQVNKTYQLLIQSFTSSN